MDRNGWQEDNWITKGRTRRILGTSYCKEILPRKENRSGRIFRLSMVEGIRKGNGGVPKNIPNVCNKAGIWMVWVQL